MRRETKIGLLAIVSLSILIWGFMFLKGKNLLSNSQIFYAEYDYVDLLLPSNPVLLNGYQIGTVIDVYQNPEDIDKLIVEMDVKNGVKLPKGTVAEINTTSVMGGKAVIIKYSGTCSGDNCHESGDFLIGRTQGMLSSMVPEEEVSNYLEIVKNGVQDLVDSLTASAGGAEGEASQSLEDIQAIIANLRSTTTRLDRTMANSSGAIESSLTDMASIIRNINEQNDRINNILANADTLTSQIAGSNLNETIAEVNLTIEQFQGTLEGVNKAVAELNLIMGKVNTSDNTLGLLVNERELYDNLNVALQNLELLLQDFRLNPKRYTRILSKKETPYEKPAEDPGIEGN